jgi:uncharacterized protein YecT (DUF1311 family)
MILIAALALAAAPEEEEPNCKEPRWQPEMTVCAYIDYEKADAAMNAEWKPLLAMMKVRDQEDSKPAGDSRPGFVAALRQGQRAWIKFRDAHCVSEGYFARGGSMEPMVIAGCPEEITKARTKQLHELLEMYQP